VTDRKQLDPALGTAQVERREVIDSRPETSRPEDRVDLLELARRPADPGRLNRLNIGPSGCVGPERLGFLSCSRSLRPVTLTTLAGGRPRATRSCTIVTASRPTDSSKWSRQTGSRRVAQRVSVTGASSPRNCTADAPPPTTSTRLPRKCSRPG
jgi:hypothetical protein